jgi:nucleoside phosphorylase
MRGVILAGGKLLEDGSLPKMRKTFHDRTRAAEMEGGGFAAACNEFSWRWMVFRGIADFGEPERVKGWQFPATVAAALVVRYGLLGGVIRGSTFLQ